jgi:hypothetical protein
MASQAYSSSPNQMTITQVSAYTTSSTVTSVSATQISYTEVQTVAGAGPPPFVTISDVKWDNTTSTLSFYMDNSGGSGTVTLAIFVAGYSGVQSFHIEGLASNTFSLTFSSYSGAESPTIQIIQEVPDSGPVPQQFVTWTAMSVTNFYTTFYPVMTTQFSTVAAPTSSQINPAPSSGPSLDLLILPLIAAVFLAWLLLSRKRKPQTATAYCTKCGKPIQPDSEFCSKCGAPQNVESSKKSN